MSLWNISFGSSLSTCVVQKVCLHDGSDVSESFLVSQSRVRVPSPSSQSWIMAWSSGVRVLSLRTVVTSSHWFASSSQCRSIWNFIFFYVILVGAMKWRLIRNTMVPDRLESGTQCCFNMFDCRLCLSLLSLHFTCLFHSQSFHKSRLTLLQVLQPLG